MKRDLLIAVVAVALTAAVAFALSAIRADGPKTPSAPFSAAAAADDEAKPGKDDKIVMHVNGQPVTEREFAFFMASAPAEGQAFYASPAGKRALANEVVKLKVLEQEAKKLGVANDPEVQTQLAMVRSQIMAGKALEKLATAKSEEKVRAEYEKEKGSAMSLRHILLAYEGGQVPPREGKTASSSDAAMKQGQSLVSQLRGGADFAALARQHSDDTQSAAQGGNLGPARPEMLPPDIAAAVAKLKAGDVSEPVKTQFGVHIFKVEQPSLEDLRPMLLQRVQREVADAEVVRLQNAAKVDLDPKFFPPAQMPPGAPPAPQAPVPQQ